MTNRLEEDLNHILLHTRELWDELRGSRIFITGGTGFFGCWLLESFLWANHQLGLGASALVLTRNPEAFQKKAPHLASHAAVHLHAGDVRTFKFPDGRVSHIIHAATESSVRLNKDNPLLMFETIVQGTQRVLEFSKRCGARKVLLTSSGAVYGKQPPDMTHIPETYTGAPDQLDPYSAYGEGKRTAELLCALYAKQYGLETKIARCFAFVGPYLPLDAHYAIGNFIRDGIKGGCVRIAGDGTPYRSYLHAADLAIWLWTILFRGSSCQPYNVGSEIEVTILELAEAVAQCFHPRREVVIGKKTVDRKAAGRYVPSTQLALHELKLHQLINLTDSIKRTIAWHSCSDV